MRGSLSGAEAETPLVHLDWSHVRGVRQGGVARKVDDPGFPAAQ